MTPDPSPGTVRDEAELLLYALLDILPMHGSWTTGYEPEETCSLTVTATGEEWGTAAHHACELHKLLRASSARTSGTDEPRCGGKGYYDKDLPDPDGPWGKMRAVCPGCPDSRSGTDEVDQGLREAVNRTVGWLDSLATLLEQRAAMPKPFHVDYDATAKEAKRYRDLLRDRIRSRMEGL